MSIFLREAVDESDLPASVPPNRELCRRIREVTRGKGMSDAARARVLAALEPLRGTAEAGSKPAEGSAGHSDK